jgi:uncharacterized protein involved in exopolysaccharide biosynthesis|tara:strand:+ start:386 stop:1168 length:783 start_codon:yes stop_codon:yes gene_type:complete
MTNRNQETQRDTSGEITLVELATTFIRRRYVFYTTFVVITILTLAYALMTPAKHEYVSLVQLAKNGQGEYLEVPEAVVASFESRWIPEQIAAFAETDGDGGSLPFRVKVANPQSTGLIRLVTEGAVDQGNLIREIHTNLLASLQELQRQQVMVERNSLEKRIESQRKVIDALQTLRGGDNTPSALASAIQTQAELEAEKEALEPMEIIVTSRQSNEAKGPGKFLIVVLGIFLAFMAGLFSAFFAEFIALVRNNLTSTYED